MSEVEELLEKIKKLGSVSNDVSKLLEEARKLKYSLEKAVESLANFPLEADIKIPVDRGEDGINLVVSSGGFRIEAYFSEDTRRKLCEALAIDMNKTYIDMSKTYRSVEALVALLFIKDNIPLIVDAIDKAANELESNYAEVRKALEEFKKLFAPLLVESRLSSS
jgi:hypothetical protein